MSETETPTPDPDSPDESEAEETEEGTETEADEEGEDSEDEAEGSETPGTTEPENLADTDSLSFGLSDTELSKELHAYAAALRALIRGRRDYRKGLPRRTR